ncbi:MAG: DUF1801 domain-containing protein [Chitinophagales bacterium]
MEIQKQIDDYITSQPAAKRDDMIALHKAILTLNPKCRLWYHNGIDEKGKVVSNPNIGYGQYTIQYADGKTKEFFRIGLSANTSGISVYIMGLPDKKYLPDTYGKTIGKASVTGYCIKFKVLKDIHMHVLEDAIRYGFNVS